MGLYDENEFDIEEMPETEEKITVFLKNTIRKSDFVFKFTGQTKWFIILSQSCEREATAFLRRLYILVKDKGIPTLEKYKPLFSASMAETGNDEGTFEDLIVEKASQPWQKV